MVESSSALANADDLGPSVEALARISHDLLSSYTALSERAARVEEELRRANVELERLHGLDKLAALGNMAGGIAHELRNPMHAVQGFASLLVRRLEGGSKEAHFAARIVEGMGEAQAILDNMLSLARPQPLVLEELNGTELLRAGIDAALAGVRDGAVAPRVTTSSPECLPRIRGDRIKLRQALRNLVANAIDAQPRGGAIHVELAATETRVELRVSDAGPGIPTELRNRVLEPFFTTRAEGTGLGLAFASEIARLHGGSVEISARPSRLGGAEVALVLPLHASPAVPSFPQSR
jgi:signal transduction histidine kinase